MVFVIILAVHSQELCPARERKVKIRAVSLTDVATLSICGLVFCSVLLNSVARYRAVARGATCSDNLRTLGAATLNYHAAYRRLPMGCGGTSAGSVDEPLQGNANRLSPLVGLLPFIQQQALWQEISNPSQSDGVTFAPMGPVPWYSADSYKPWGMRPPILVCSADTAAADQFETATSYSINYGDAILNVGGAPLNKSSRQFSQLHAVQRGAFAAQRVLKYRDFLDGLSNTILMSERRIGGPKVAKDVDRGLAMNPSLCIAANGDEATEFWAEGRTACWVDGILLSIGFQTILPPNSPSASTTLGAMEGVMSASSNHAGGVHVLFAGGAVKFATDSIDSGDHTSPSVALGAVGGATPGSGSPYGLWGALGTRFGKERFSLDNDCLIAPVIAAVDLAKLKLKPLQTWRTADGSLNFKARLISIQQSGKVLLLTEDGRRTTFKLSDLASEDAYRAIEDMFEEKQQSKRTLIAQLQEGIQLLNQKKTDEFVRLFFEGKLSEQETAEFSSERTVIIHELETAISVFRSPSPAAIVTEDEQSDTFRVQAVTPIIVDIAFKKTGDRWKIVR
jgi:hypothetical protein